MANQPTNQPKQPSSPQTGNVDELRKLRAENAVLRERLAEAEENQKATPNTRPQPERPSFGLSAGEEADLVQYGVTNSPFTGERLTASDEGVEPGNPEAEKADERANREPKADSIKVTDVNKR